MKKMKLPMRLLFILILVLSLSMQSCSLLKDVEEVGKNETTNGAFETEANTETENNSEASREPEREPENKVDISFTATGDNLIHPNIYTEAQWRATDGKAYDFTPMFSDVRYLIEGADFAFINQETLMAGEGYEVSGYPAFNSPQELGDDLVEMGFDIIGMSNNHMLDVGASGLASCIEFWRSKPVVAVGAYSDREDAANIRTVEKDGVTVALLSYTYGTNGIVLPADSELDIPYISDERIVSDLAAAREISDFIIVSVHWGEEYSTTENAEQERLAGLMAENGAGVILGHHSHTLQPLKWIDRSDGGKTLCIYSLGNLVSAMMYPSNMVGGFLSFHLTGDKDNLEVTNVSFEPTVFYYSTSFYDTHIYLLKDYNNTIAATSGTLLYGDATTRETAEQLVKDAIPSEYLPDWLK